MSETLESLPRHGRLARLALLGALYFVQGLPFGVQVGILPVLMRTRGASRETIAYASALALPWMLKALWAPVVERVYLPSIGRRRTWLLAMQAVAIVAFASLAVSAGSDSLVPLVVGLFVLNLAMATMDVAVDGLAVDLLADDELGPGNAAQVGGYKLGMLFAGGFALQFLRWASWSHVFASLLVPLVLVFVGTLVVREPAPRASSPNPRITHRDVMRLLGSLVSTRPARYLVALLVLYKAGEAMADAQMRPFLVDAGFSAADIGLVLGVCGAFASTAGSLVGGAIGARARSRIDALFIVAAVRVLPLVGQLGLVLLGPSHDALLVVSLAEHFAGGMLTTLVFALMMSTADRTFGGTSFTLLATVETVGKGLTGFVSGKLADSAGDTVVFGAAVGLSIAFLLLHPGMRRCELEGAYHRA